MWRRQIGDTRERTIGRQDRHRTSPGVLRVTVCFGPDPASLQLPFSARSGRTAASRGNLDLGDLLQAEQHTGSYPTVAARIQSSAAFFVAGLSAAPRNAPSLVTPSGIILRTVRKSRSDPHKNISKVHACKDPETNPLSAPVNRAETVVTQVGIEHTHRRSCLYRVSQEGEGGISSVPQEFDSEGMVLIDA